MPLLFRSTLTLATSLLFFFQIFRVRVRFSVRFSVRVSVKVSVRATVRVKVRFKVYLLCLLHFCQASCCRHLGGKIDTAYFILRATGRSGPENKL